MFRHVEASSFSVLEPTNSITPSFFLHRSQFWREGESGSDRSPKRSLRSGSKPANAPQSCTSAPSAPASVVLSWMRQPGLKAAPVIAAGPRLQGNRRAVQLLPRLRVATMARLCRDSRRHRVTAAQLRWRERTADLKKKEHSVSLFHH